MGATLLKSIIVDKAVWRETFVKDVEFATIAHFLFRTTFDGNWLDEIGLFQFLQLLNQQRFVILVSEAAENTTKEINYRKSN